MVRGQPLSARQRAVDRAVEWGPPVPAGAGIHPGARLVLWDLRGGFSGWWRFDAMAHRRAYTAVLGRVPTCLVPPVSGPDPLVAAAMLRANGVPEAEVGRLLPRYLPAFATALSGLAGREPDIVPRPVDLLWTIRILAGDPDTFQSFIAWEIRPSIRIKFATIGLDRLLDPWLGGCGSDHTDGAVLAGLARDRVQRRHHRNFDDQDVQLVPGSRPDLVAEQDFDAVSGGTP
jgi:hypothetical protein